VIVNFPVPEVEIEFEILVEHAIFIVFVTVKVPLPETVEPFSLYVPETVTAPL